MSAILNRWCCRIFILTFAVCLFPRLSLAAEGLDSGDTALVIVSSTLVLMMTLPGLLLFYAGLVRSVNVISTSIHCYAIACLASVLWFAVGYSLAFGDGGQANAWIGGLEKAFLARCRCRCLSRNDPGVGLPHVSDDIHHHYARLDRRCLRGTDQVRPCDAV